MPEVVNKSVGIIRLPFANVELKPKQTTYLDDETYEKVKAVLHEYRKLCIVEIKETTKAVTMKLEQNEDGSISLTSESDKVVVESAPVQIAEETPSEEPKEEVAQEIPAEEQNTEGTKKKKKVTRSEETPSEEPKEEVAQEIPAEEQNTEGTKKKKKVTRSKSIGFD